jgi:two-component system NarL family sensor kinase
MTARPHDDGGARLALALLRASLVALILISEQLVDRRALAESGFFVVLALAAAYAIAELAVAAGLWRGPLQARDGGRLWVRVQPPLDVLLLTTLACTSGGAASDVRKAFFVIPLAAAFSERPRATAVWSVVAVAAFSLQAALVGGHLIHSQNTWQRLTLDQALYLAWIGAAATTLSAALRRRSAHTEELAGARQRLVRHAIETVERERTRLAGALHDAPVQNLIAARHDLRRAERSGDPDSFRRLHDAINATLSELREEIFNLHPHVLDHVGLGAALEQVAHRHDRAGDVRINVAIDADERDIPHRQVLFALARELLGNAAKHAGARAIDVRVWCEGVATCLEVRDDGHGIPPGRIRQALLDGHIGLAGIRERVEALSGTFVLDSTPGSGTVARVSLPLASSDRGEISDRVAPPVALRVSTA